MSQLLSAASAYVEGGLSVIPVYDKIPASVLPTRWDDKKQKNVLSWLDFQQRKPTHEELERWFTDPRVNGIGGVGGSVSGNLCVLDFDVPEFFSRWRERMDKPLRSITTPLPTQQTPSGGFQVWFRCAEPGRNQKLAWVATPSGKPEIAIETRGAGGYALLPPSHHPNGGVYKAIEGDFTSVPVVEMDLALDMLETARSLSEIKPQQIADVSRPTQALRDRLTVSGHIIDEFNSRYTVVDWLEQYGYRLRGDRMVRPDGKSASVTLSTDHRLSYHFSSNDPLANTPKPFHDPFSVYQHLVCGGDFAAAKSSAARLLGIVYHETNRESTPQITKDHYVGEEKHACADVSDQAFYLADFAGSQTVVLVESSQSADPHQAARLLRDLGVSAISGPRSATWPVVWLDRVRSFKRKYVWMAPPVNAAIEDLALDADALIVNAAVDPKTFLTEWNGTQHEVLSFLLTAIEPIGRVGARGLWR